MNFIKCNVILILIVILFTSCGVNEPFPSPDSIYFNSFENDADTTGWKDINPTMFVDDPCPNGGKKSLRIGGGCLQPASYFVLKPAEQTGRFQLRFWAKAAEPQMSGTIQFGLGDIFNPMSKTVSVHVRDASWKYYSSDLLNCSSGFKMFIKLFVGGIVPNEIFIDNLEVVLVR